MVEIKIDISKFDLSAAKIWNSEKKERLGKFAATTWHKLYEPYVPFKSGDLSNKVEIRPWEIEHTSPYARYLYYGKVLGPNFPISEGGRIVGYFSKPGRPKSPTGKMLKYNQNNGHPKACAKWDQVAWPVQGAELIKAMQGYIDRGGLK